MIGNVEKPLTVLIGGFGFIGSHLRDRLEAEKRPYLNVGRTSALFFNGEVIEKEYGFGDINLSHWIESSPALSSYDQIQLVYLATASVPLVGGKSRVSELQNNISVLAHFYQEAIRMGVKRFVYLSSGGEVYGQRSAEPVKETQVLNPVTTYGWGKKVCEELLTSFEAPQMEIYKLRPSNPVGRHQASKGRAGGFLPLLVRNAISGAETTMYVPPTLRRNYFDADGLIGLIVSILDAEYPSTLNCELNVGTEHSISMLELVQIVSKVLSKRVNIKQYCDPVQEKLMVMDTSLNCGKAERLFGWQSKSDIVALVEMVASEILSSECVSS